MNMLKYIPVSYTNATPEERAKICNGCGAKDGIKVPSTMYGLSIEKACQIHDWMFEEGTTLGDFWFANLMFFWNLTVIIVNKSNWLTMPFRMSRALKYFLAVALKGSKAYWANKSENELMHITIKGEFKNVQNNFD